MKGNLVGLSSPMALPFPQSTSSVSGVHNPGWSHPYKTSLWSPVFYADGDNEGGGNDNGTGGAGSGSGDGGKGSSGSGGDDSNKGQSKGDNPEGKIKALEEEKDRHFTKRQEAETALQEAQAKLKQIEDAGKSDLEKATSELEEVRKAQEGLQNENQDLRLQLAFVTDNTYKWKNPKAALKLADLSDVEIKDGKVSGLNTALEKLAKSDPYLLEEDDSKKKDGEDKQKQTGQQHNGGKGKGTGPDQQALLKKYPALRGR